MAIQRLLTPTETAELLGVARETLAMWRCTRRVELPFVRVGRCVRYLPEDVQRFVAARRVTGSADLNG
jgi:excisionase family DNA binding protein